MRRGGREVVRIPALDVPAGSVTGLLGPSGCGKTTLMRAIVGVQIVASGPSTCSACLGSRRCARAWASAPSASAT